MARDAPSGCPVCGGVVQEAKQKRTYCSDLCRNRAFRERQTKMGRTRTRIGYADGLSAWDARDRYGDPA